MTTKKMQNMASRENRKKLFPCARNSLHGATIAARLHTMQSVKINRPRAPSHMMAATNARMIKPPITVRAITHHSICATWPRSGKDSAIAFRSSRALQRERGLNE
jgi:hypothetical protein